MNSRARTAFTARRSRALAIGAIGAFAAFGASAVSPAKVSAQQPTASCMKDRGQLALFPAVSRYTTRGYYDDNGHARRYQDDGIFTRAQVSIYAEYGITRKVGLIANEGVSQLVTQSTQPTPTTRENIALGNPEIGVQLDVSDAPVLSYLFCAFSVVLKLPFRGGGEPLVGYAQTDLEGRLRSVGWLKVGDHGGYWVLDLGMRHRFGPPGDAVKLDATTALDITPNLAALLQFSATTALRSGIPALSSANSNVYPDYSSYYPQVGVLYRLAPGLRVQASWSREIAGRNAGNGQTVSIVWWVGA